MRTSSGSTQRRPNVDRTKERNVVCDEGRGNVNGVRVLGALEPTHAAGRTDAVSVRFVNSCTYLKKPSPAS